MEPGRTRSTKQAETNFKSKHPNAKVDEWFEEEGKIGCYFEQGEKYGQAYFTKKGDWVRTEYGLTIEEIPNSINESIFSNYKGYEIMDASERLSPAGTQYQVSLYEPESEEDIVVLFDKTGKVLRAKSMNEED